MGIKNVRWSKELEGELYLTLEFDGEEPSDAEADALCAEILSLLQYNKVVQHG